MSVSDVTARIAQIQSQLALLTPRPQTAGSTAFASALDGATTVDGVTATGGRAYSGDIAASGDAVVTEARRYLGVPYVWGGTSEKGLDCSGLVQLVYKNLGYDLPRLSADQAKAGAPVASMADARPGDLIAWDNSSRNNGADHIAIYLGNGKMIEAPRTGMDVRITDVPTTPDYIRRIVPADGASTAVNATGRISTASPYADLFTRASEKYGVPAALLSAVARQESGYDPKAVSPAGAQGLMQLMPGTAKGLGVTNSFDPAQAVDGAARMLRDLTHRFGSTPLALAAYNAGPGAVLKYDGIPPYPETQRYVRSVMALMKESS